jgi:hypothetical protein
MKADSYVGTEICIAYLDHRLDPASGMNLSSALYCVSL